MTLITNVMYWPEYNMIYEEKYISGLHSHAFTEQMLLLLHFKEVLCHHVGRRASLYRNIGNPKSNESIDDPHLLQVCSL